MEYYFQLTRFALFASLYAPGLNLVENTSYSFQKGIIEWLSDRVQHTVIHFWIRLHSNLTKKNFCCTLVKKKNTRPLWMWGDDLSALKELIFELCNSFSPIPYCFICLLFLWRKKSSHSWTEYHCLCFLKIIWADFCIKEPTVLLIYHSVNGSCSTDIHLNINHYIQYY